MSLKLSVGKFPVGSKWRKWDLHIHTPISLSSEYGGNTKEVWDKFFAELEELSTNIKVIGINDYLFLDGYEKVLKYKQSGGLKNIDLLLPVIEFRLKEFVGSNELKRINYHIIFADESQIGIETIKTQFLSQFKGKANLDAELLKGYSWGGVVTPGTLQDYGKHIHDNTPADKRDGKGFLEIGFNNINFDLLKVKEILGEGADPNTYLKGNYLKAIGKAEWEAFRWESSPSEKKTIINECHFVFSASPTIEKANSGRNSLREQGVNNRLLHCSDAHGFSKDKIRTDSKELGHCFTWIKADPTFDGLKQILVEPDDRIFIGEMPPILERVKDNRTKYLKGLSINSIADYTGAYGKWFDNIYIELNHELVAVIGNKGSGKSAIADIISHCSNHREQDDFSFLHNDKFRENDLASHFEATLHWESHDAPSKNLSEEDVEGDLQLVKYLPQGYFERITNEIGTAEGFRNEIEKVVFTHLDDENKGGFASLSELINSKIKSVDRDLELLRDNIGILNAKIVAYERKLNPKHKKEIESKIEAKQKEINALVQPKAVANPDVDKTVSEANRVVIEKINKLKEAAAAVDLTINQFQQQKNNLLAEIGELTELKDDISFQVKQIIDFKKSRQAIFDKHKLPADELVKVESNVAKLENLLLAKQQSLKKIRIALGEEPSSEPEFQSEIVKQEKISQEIKQEQEKLDGPQKAYQKYLIDVKTWEAKKAKLVGSESNADTLKYLEKELKYVNEILTLDLAQAYEDRLALTRAVFDKKQDVLKIYKQVKSRLDSIIDENRNLLNEYDINIDASLTMDTTFNRTFFQYINQNFLGTYYSIEGGDVELEKIKKGVNFESISELEQFLGKIVKSFHEDQREGYNRSARFIDDQLKNPTELYSWLFSLDFLKYNYQLKQNKKLLHQLSPGERGALLLVFYLLLDNDDKPLIIDQPEDNLDNNSVANILVPFIRKAKGKRQIIMVTHNPNLAVVSDAEQVIRVNIDKENQNEFSFNSGSIEDRTVNENIVEVLEGAMPAFNKRKQKYYE